MDLLLRQKAGRALLAAGSAAAVIVLALEKSEVLYKLLEQPFRTGVRATVLLMLFAGTALVAAIPKDEVQDYEQTTDSGHTDN